MSIQHAANVIPASHPGPHAALRPLAATPPRVLESARAPAQLSFAFKRG